jgi:hypothetical protein
VQESDAPARLEAAAVLGAVAALAVGAVGAWRHGWYPAFDHALMELRIRDIATTPPTLGAYSRLGWSHPGPAGFYLLAVAYALGGFTSVALLVGALAVAAASLVGAWALARQVDRLAGVVVLFALTVEVAILPPALLRDPWNPYLGLVLFATLIVSGWSCAQRRPAGALAMLPIAALLVQTHLGFAAPAAAVCIAGLGVMVIGWSDQRTAVPKAQIAIGTAVCALMWVPPLVQQARNHPGNMTLIARSASEGDHVGLGLATRLVVRATSVPASWFLATPRTFDGLSPAWSVPFLLVLPTAAWLVAVRRRDLPAIRGLGVATAALLGCWVGLARYTGPVYGYLMPWLAPTVTALCGISLWVIVRAAPARTRRWGSIAACIATLALAGAVAVRQWSAPPPAESLSEAVRDLTPAAESFADHHRVLVTSEDDFNSTGVALGLLLQLDRSAIPAGGTFPTMLSEHRTSLRPGGPELRVAPLRDAGVLQSEGWSAVGSVDPFSIEERRELDELWASLDRLEARISAAEATGASDEAARRERYLVAARERQVVDGRVGVVLMSRESPGERD